MKIFGKLPRLGIGKEKIWHDNAKFVEKELFTEATFPERDNPKRRVVQVSTLGW
jgi:hypothetical protein